MVLKHRSNYSETSCNHNTNSQITRHCQFSNATRNLRYHEAFYQTNTEKYHASKQCCTKLLNAQINTQLDLLLYEFILKYALQKADKLPFISRYHFRSQLTFTFSKLKALLLYFAIAKTLRIAKHGFHLPHSPTSLRHTRLLNPQH